MQKTDRIWLDGSWCPGTRRRCTCSRTRCTTASGCSRASAATSGATGARRSSGCASTSIACSARRTSSTSRCRTRASRSMEACRDTVRANDLRECYLRPIAFLGDGEMGLSARPPTRVAIAAWPWGAYLGDEGVKNGVRLKTSSFQRFHPNTLLTKAKAVGHYVNSILAAQEARARRATTRRSCSTSTATCRRPAARTSSSSSRGVVKTTPLPTVLGGITRDAALRLLADARRRDPRGALHARRGLPGGRGVLHRHRGRDHADPRARRPPHRHRPTRAGDDAACRSSSSRSSAAPSRATRRGSPRSDAHRLRSGGVSGSYAAHGRRHDAPTALDCLRRHCTTGRDRMRRRRSTRAAPRRRPRRLRLRRRRPPPRRRPRRVTTTTSTSST